MAQSCIVKHRHVPKLYGHTGGLRVRQEERKKIIAWLLLWRKQLRLSCFTVSPYLKGWLCGLGIMPETIRLPGTNTSWQGQLSFPPSKVALIKRRVMPFYWMWELSGKPIEHSKRPIWTLKHLWHFLIWLRAFLPISISEALAPCVL